MFPGENSTRSSTDVIHTGGDNSMEEAELFLILDNKALWIFIHKLSTLREHRFCQTLDQEASRPGSADVRTEDIKGASGDRLKMSISPTAWSLVQHGAQMYLDVLSPRALRRVSGAERTIDLPLRVTPSAFWQFSLGRLRFSFETTPIWYQLHPIRGSASVFRA